MTMKRRRNVEEEVSQNGKKARNEHISDTKMTDLLKRCLQKVCELQADLARESDEEDDAEAAGYAACAVETLRFLAAEGLPANHPMVRGLEERLMNGRNRR